MITDRIINYALAGLLVAALVWGGWQWAAKMNLRHTLDEYKLAQANLVTKAQEDYIEHQRKEADTANAARLAVKSAVLAVENDYGPTVAAYNAMSASISERLRASSNPVGAVSPGSEDASRTQGSSCDRRLEEIDRRFAQVVEDAGRVAANFKSCTAGITRYRAAVGWADAPR